MLLVKYFSIFDAFSKVFLSLCQFPEFQHRMSILGYQHRTTVSELIT